MGPPGLSEHNHTKVVNHVLSSRVHEEELKCAKENDGCLQSLGEAASEVVCGDRALVSGLRGGRVAKCLHISASYLHCPLGDNQHTAPSRQDYKDKIEPKWLLHSSNRDLFTKGKLFQAFFKVLAKEEEVVKKKAAFLTLTGRIFYICARTK